jgi:UDP-2,3-diacylglucosamine pyrophosphatase LpxH
VAVEHGTRLFRTLFISDVHLGARGSQADRLLDFLRWHDADTIYLVGDIVDGWQLRSAWYWPQHHNDVVQKLLRKARKGTRIIYVPGNHDEFLRDYYGTHFGGIKVVETAMHDGADGQRYLVVHGDMFDLVVRQARWLALLGDKAYDFAIVVNRYFNAVRRLFGRPYWSLSQWAKQKVKNAVNYIGAFEKTLAAEARLRRAQASSAAISTTPPSMMILASATSIAATGSKAAPPSPSMRMAGSKSSPGRTAARKCRH